MCQKASTPALVLLQQLTRSRSIQQKATVQHRPSLGLASTPPLAQQNRETPRVFMETTGFCALPAPYLAFALAAFFLGWGFLCPL